MRQVQDPNVAFKLWFKVGSQNDPEGKEGLAALTAEMVGDSGTRAGNHQVRMQLAHQHAIAFAHDIAS